MPVGADGKALYLFNISHTSAIVEKAVPLSQASLSGTLASRWTTCALTCLEHDIRHSGHHNRVSGQRKTRKTGNTYTTERTETQTLGLGGIGFRTLLLFLVLCDVRL
jgi:hypothetical protein